MANTTEAQNVIVKDLEFFWAKLGKPVDPFGTLQWEMQVRFPKKREEEMEAYGKVKPVDGEKGKLSVNLRKKALKADGSPAQQIEVVDTKGELIDPRTIGNGSKGNVKLMLRDYEVKGPNGKVTKRGTQVMLTKVQVTELVKYEPKSTNDFDYDDTDLDDEQAEAAETQAKKVASKKAPAAKGKPGRPKKVADMDDDIPF
jgi:hypothetical protein